jgi:hypothetical protein
MPQYVHARHTHLTVYFYFFSLYFILPDCGEMEVVLTELFMEDYGCVIAGHLLYPPWRTALWALITGQMLRGRGGGGDAEPESGADTDADDAAGERECVIS